MHMSSSLHKHTLALFYWLILRKVYHSGSLPMVLSELNSLPASRDFLMRFSCVDVGEAIKTPPTLKTQYRYTRVRGGTRGSVVQVANL